MKIGMKVGVRLLIERYQNISLQKLFKIEKEIKEREIPFSEKYVMNAITGFGKKSTCILCKVASENCYNCIHGELSVHIAKNRELKFLSKKDLFCQGSSVSSYSCTRHFSYYLISNATSPRKLYYAIQQRIAYLELLLKELENYETST